MTKSLHHCVVLCLLLNHSRLHLIVLVWIANHCTKGPNYIMAPTLQTFISRSVNSLGQVFRWAGGSLPRSDSGNWFLLSWDSALPKDLHIIYIWSVEEKTESQGSTLIILKMYPGSGNHYLYFKRENLVRRPCLAARGAGKCNLAFYSWPQIYNHGRRRRFDFFHIQFTLL